MRIAALVSIAVLLGGAGSPSRMPEQPGCGVFSFSAATVAERRHGRVILAAEVSSPDEALKIAHGVALGMAELVELDVVEVHVSRLEDAAALAVPGTADPGATAIASLRLAPAEAGRVWDAQIHVPRGPEDRRGRLGDARQALDAVQIEARISRDPLSAAARRTLCGIR